jgi:hypothetical protein
LAMTLTTNGLWQRAIAVVAVQGVAEFVGGQIEGLKVENIEWKKLK